MLMMFLINAFVSPLMWTFNFTYLYKKFRIFLIERKENPDAHHHKTQDELNELYELPSMDIFYKYSYIANTLLMSFFYIPIFPLGVPISLLGFILGYFLEKFNFFLIYKRPEKLNQNICLFYIENFKLILFCYSIGCFLFMNDVFPHNKWTLSNLIIFGLLCFIPFSKIFVYDLEIKESDLHTQSFRENKNNKNFLVDYEKKNPITIYLKMKKILKMLKNEGLINEEIYNKYINLIDGKNIMNFYYENINKEEIKKELEKKNYLKKKTLLNKKTEKKNFDLNDDISNFFNEKKEYNNNIITKKTSDIDYNLSNDNNYNFLEFINLYNFENTPFGDDSQLNDIRNNKIDINNNISDNKIDNDENISNNIIIINNNSSNLNNNDNNLVNDDNKINYLNSENFLINSDSNFNNYNTKNNNNLNNLNSNNSNNLNENQIQIDIFNKELNKDDNKSIKDDEDIDELSNESKNINIPKNINLKGTICRINN